VQAEGTDPRLVALGLVPPPQAPAPDETPPPAEEEAPPPGVHHTYSEAPSDEPESPWLAKLRRVAAAEEALRRAIDYARRAGDERTEAQALNLSVGAAFHGPLPVPAAIRRCDQILERPPDQQRVVASAYRALAGLKAMQGDFAEARDLARRDRTILEDLGLRVTAAVSAEIYGLVELLAGDPEAAERELRAGYETLERLGARRSLSNVSPTLAQALFAQGRDDDALRMTEVAEQVSAPDDRVPQVQWRAARARVLARRGDVEQAERLAREAVAIAEATPEFLVLHADALVDLAHVLVAAGRAGDAASAAAHALELYARKEHAVAERRTRALVDELAVAGAAAGTV
jgi:tetratricopeptide (TPR) repeat protein